MKRIGIALLALTGLLPLSALQADDNRLRARLAGTQEVPAVSTDASGGFQARLVGEALHYELRYADLEGAISQAHIHFGQRSVNGGVAAFLCSNLGNGPTGTQACPASPATITGIITSTDVVGPAAQGLAPGEFDELVRALRNGTAYVNVHTNTFPGGEIRAQLNDHGHD